MRLAVRLNGLGKGNMFMRKQGSYKKLQPFFKSFQGLFKDHLLGI